MSAEASFAAAQAAQKMGFRPPTATLWFAAAQAAQKDAETGELLNV